MLEIEGLSRRFGRVAAVEDVSLRIPQGQMVGVIGRSGAGKSTLLRLINRMAEPTSGRIRFEGREVGALRGAALRDWRTGCAMIFQQFNLVQRLDVLTNVLVGRLNHRAGFAARLGALLGRFTPPSAPWRSPPRPLRPAGHRAPARETLSGGQQQRAAICRRCCRSRA
jgi:phosphonate transport system ATP-binding protein